MLLFSRSSIKHPITIFAFASHRVLILDMVPNFINAQIHHEDSIDLRRNYKDDKTRALVLEKQACKHQTHEVSDTERLFLPCNMDRRRLDTTCIYSSCVSIVGCVNIFVRFFPRRRYGNSRSRALASTHTTRGDCRFN